MILRSALILVLAGAVQDVPELRKSGSEKLQKGDYAGAIEDFSRVLEQSPKERLMYLLRSEARRLSGDLDGALSDATQAIDLGPTFAAPYAARASAKHRKKDFAGAIQDYSEAIRRRPKEADFWVNRGAVKLESDDHRGAIDDCKQALELNPKEAVALQNMGTAYWRLNDLDAARSAFTTVIEFEPAWPSGHHMRGMMEYCKGDYDAALKDIDRAIQLAPEDPDYPYLRACCLMGKSNGKEAKAAFDRALEAADEGWFFRRRAESLLAVLPELTAGPPTVPFGRRLLEQGRAVLAKGETDKAIEILEEAVRVAPRSLETLEALVGGLLQRNDPKRGDRRRAKVLVFDAVALGEGLSPRMQRHLNAVGSPVLAGVRWLAHHQMADGRWSGGSVVEACRKDATPRCGGKDGTESDLRATSLAILAFMGAGYCHLSKDNYDTKPIGETVKKALEWMLARQKPDGGFGDPVSARFLEDHAIATLAMSEVYGISASDFLKGPAQKAVDFLVANRIPGRGWAFHPKQTVGDPVATGWALFALQSAKLSELPFPSDARDQGLDWLTGVALKAKPARRDAAATFAVAAASFLGKELDADLLKAHQKAIVDAPPGNAAEESDALYALVSAVALLGENGELWRSWQEGTNKTIQQAARRDDEDNGCPAGSWDAVGPADGPRGRVITTALNTMTLEICARFLYALGTPYQK